jgi:hypothetical protein
MVDRDTKERKLIALMVNNLGPGFGGDQERFAGAPDMSHEPRPEEREG